MSAVNLAAPFPLFHLDRSGPGDGAVARLATLTPWLEVFCGHLDRGTRGAATRKAIMTGPGVPGGSGVAGFPSLDFALGRGGGMPSKRPLNPMQETASYIGDTSHDIPHTPLREGQASAASIDDGRSFSALEMIRVLAKIRFQKEPRHVTPRRHSQRIVLALPAREGNIISRTREEERAKVRRASGSVQTYSESG
ncbi:hypothetical protein CSOJ01_00994 [Colletotrichum sojae]|uniref:Uncharacterized protein n=1 Tax=Colletotrichum sojae TaxID=2175907 RepID=A0A8H6JWE1_9PEZI|nr:hypothetical protein CSOJ01_00994 [Colletotrichum sojae]